MSYTRNLALIRIIITVIKQLFLLKLIEKDLTRLATKVLNTSFKFGDNLTEPEQKSLQDLGSDSSIVI